MYMMQYTSITKQQQLDGIQYTYVCEVIQMAKNQATLNSQVQVTTENKKMKKQEKTSKQSLEIKGEVKYTF